MTSFKFRLDKILDYRKYLTKVAQIELFKAKNEYIRREKQVKRLSEKRQELSKSCIEEGVKGIDVPRYRIFQAYLYKIERELESAHSLLEQEKENVITQKTILKNESIKEKSLDTLKSIKHNKYVELSERQDQKVLDEIVISGRGRRP
jgi:flagellar export protein FliJ